MIILEGPDLIGKTTLAKALSKQANLNYVHYSRLKDDHDRFLHYYPDIRPHNCMDRFYMSEPVYALVRDEETRQHPAMTIALDRECMARGALMIVLTGTEELIIDRYNKAMSEGRAEMYNLEQILLANQYFSSIGCTGELGNHLFHVDVHLTLTLENPVLCKEDIDLLLFAHQLCGARAAYLRSTREFPRPIET